MDSLFDKQYQLNDNENDDNENNDNKNNDNDNRIDDNNSNNNVNDALNEENYIYFDEEEQLHLPRTLTQDNDIVVLDRGMQ